MNPQKMVGDFQGEDLLEFGRDLACGGTARN
jgi:hypothetical protein